MPIEDAIKLARQPITIVTVPSSKGNAHATGGGAFSHPLAIDDMIANNRGGGQ